LPENTLVDLEFDVMADAPWDAIIVGQGLAGTTLAWHLHEAGQRVLVIDADETVTSSKIAAGLMTPATGQRLVLSWRWDEFLPVARDFYRRIEVLTGQTFFYERRAVRLFKSDAERVGWSKRSQDAAYRAVLSEPQPVPLLAHEIADASDGGIEMRGAQLDVAAYLAASRAELNFEVGTLDWRRDVGLQPDEISVCGHRTRRLISCEGYAATKNPYFTCVPFNAAKGDILRLRFHGPMPPVSIHRGIWIAPTAASDVFRVGSTYDWETLDQVPGAQARAEIEAKLRAFVRVPYTVIEHQAAVRPIIHLSEAVLGMHPAHARLGFFNGLGSKGALHAPWFAKCFADFLARGVPVPAALDVGKVWR
jgi:glycine oxidase